MFFFSKLTRNCLFGKSSEAYFRSSSCSFLKFQEYLEKIFLKSFIYSSSNFFRTSLKTYVKNYSSELFRNFCRNSFRYSHNYSITRFFLRIHPYFRNFFMVFYRNSSKNTYRNFSRILSKCNSGNFSTDYIINLFGNFLTNISI